MLQLRHFYLEDFLKTNFGKLHFQFRYIHVLEIFNILNRTRALKLSAKLNFNDISDATAI